MQTELLKVRRSRIQGRGVFARRQIRKGKRLIEYTGERITAKESDIRYADDGLPHHTFLFSVDSRMVIDATRRGSVAKYINHSCEPNCEAVIEEGRVYIEALRSIRPGAEVTYDYNLQVAGRHTEEVKALYRCYCGADKCRRTLIEPRPTRKKVPRRPTRRGAVRKRR